MAFFNHRDKTYKAPPEPNPFAGSADAAYADILAGMQKDKNFWRNIVGCGALVLFAASIAVSAYAISLQKTVPVLVNVMPSGEAEYLGKVRQGQGVAVPEAAIQYQAKKFIQNMRTISTDPAMTYRNINECFAMATGKAGKLLEKDLREDKPFAEPGKRRREVRIESILTLSGRTYQIEWTESESEAGESAARKTRRRAAVTVKLLPVTDKTIQANPLGIYIDDYSMAVL